jgi:AraC-like DNA-binding protein
MWKRRAPGPALRPFVGVLPTGTAHVVVRLSDHPLHLFDGEGDPIGRSVSLAVVGGPRAGFYVRDVSKPNRSVGAQLLPGAAEVLLGVPAGELASRHTPLGDIWGRRAAEARERLLGAPTLDAQLDLFESILAERALGGGRAPFAVAHAVRRFKEGAGVREVVAETGYSHRHFIEIFQRDVGLAPKVYCRVQRIQRALALAGPGAGLSWVEVAVLAGYADQPHLSRELRELCGVTPGEYRETAKVHALHVPVLGSISFKTGAALRDQAARDVGRALARAGDLL